MYLQVLAAREHFSAAWKRTGKWLFAGVYPDVVDQLVLGLERLQKSTASAPHARVVGLFGTTHVVHGDVCHDLVHRRIYLAARFAGP